MNTAETTYMKPARILGLPTQFEQYETMGKIKYAGVSIIINNERYDSVNIKNEDVCSECDLRPICEEDRFIKCYNGQGFVFKKYNKSIEDDTRRANQR